MAAQVRRGMIRVLEPDPECAVGAGRVRALAQRGAAPVTMGLSLGGRTLFAPPRLIATELIVRSNQRAF